MIKNIIILKHSKNFNCWKLKSSLPPVRTIGHPEILIHMPYNNKPNQLTLFTLKVQDVFAIRNTPREHHDAGSRADKTKKNLFDAIRKNDGKIVDLTKNIGTEISGIRLDELTDEQKDELALLVAERSVVFLRGQEGLSPKVQRDLGAWWGEVEVHPQVPHVPGLPGVTVMWPALQASETSRKTDFRNPGGASRWHSDLVHELHPAGLTHLHNDTVPEVGGDTLWASGYAAYSKLSPEFRKFIDGKQAIYVSAHTYLDRDDPTAGPKHIERVHPIVRVHPVTGWKTLWVNRSMTKSIVGLDKAESDLILGYLYDVSEKNVDIQVRFRWTAGSSAIWVSFSSGFFMFFGLRSRLEMKG
ncbi:hypothetical protein OCU04_005455 [Sclerotinia nivalis]|uniref:TauD/TfdA-like domain-containing protein n=1 Tax=Sclerotinia nivalis TaxID=352851 RepID=A0A9X0DJZ2_9HELO|nr:hypothetical protein OCU04_005455 [Sclerotinia nivalis]